MERSVGELSLPSSLGHELLRVLHGRSELTLYRRCVILYVNFEEEWAIIFRFEREEIERSLIAVTSQGNYSDIRGRRTCCGGQEV